MTITVRKAGIVVAGPQENVVALAVPLLPGEAVVARPEPAYRTGRLVEGLAAPGGVPRKTKAFLALCVYPDCGKASEVIDMCGRACPMSGCSDMFNYCYWSWITAPLQWEEEEPS